MKGTPSQGKHSTGKTHIQCRRCGEHAFHASHGICSHCGFGKTAKLRQCKKLKQIRVAIKRVR